MKISRTAPALLLSWLGLTALLYAPAAQAQWKWRDASGAIQYSDRPPPAGVPEAAILQRPLAPRPVAAPKPVASDAEGGASAPVAKPAPSKAESELDAKKRKAEEEQLAKRKADEEKAAKARADNCQRARQYQKTLSDGIRIARTNAAGEREVLDDKGRADEMQRNQEVITNNCK